MKVIIFTDGAARGNPDGPGGYGAIIRVMNEQGKTLEKPLKDAIVLHHRASCVHFEMSSLFHDAQAAFVSSTSNR